MKRAIVTGATGFVGANLARRLLHDGHEVHLLVRPDHAVWRMAGIADDVRLHAVDFGDRARLKAVIAAVRPDWVFHLAAYGAYSLQADLDQMVATNVLGTMNLVRACVGAGVEALVNTGSSSEYGFKDHGPPETEWLEPNSHYAITKAAATHYCRFTATTQVTDGGMRLPTLRLYAVYGPWEEPTRLLPMLLVHGLEGRLPPLVDPRIARDYVHVDDVCDAYLLAAGRADQEPGAVYNVGTGVQTSLGELVALARRQLGVAAEPVWGSMPNRSWDTAVWVADNRKIRHDLGWEPRLTPEAGLAATAAWFRDDPSRLRFYRDRQAKVT